MIPQPLHPAVVHLPLALAVLLPGAMVVALFVIRRGGLPRHVWAVPLGLAALLSGTAWLALETGEGEEDLVERYVSESALHEHEEAAERFLLLSAVVTFVAVAGLASGAMGTTARAAAVAGSVVLLAAGIQVGAAGGELVYRHGAAAAYVTASDLGASQGVERGGAEEGDEDPDGH